VETVVIGYINWAVN